MARNLLRYRDLEARNIFNNRVQLKRAVDNDSFPTGFMLSPNIRAWFEDEVDAWLESRPSALEAKPKPRGAVRKRAAGEYVRPWGSNKEREPEQVDLETAIAEATR